MSEKEFLQHRNALVTIKSEKPKRLQDRAAILWGEIQTRQLKFLRAQIEIRELESVTRDDLLPYVTVISFPYRRLYLNICFPVNVVTHTPNLSVIL